MAVYEITLSATPQSFSVRLSGNDYRITLKYQDATMGGWFIDIADENGQVLVNGIPLVTGCDLLAPFKHLGFSGELRVQTSDNPDAVPTWDNLGTKSHLYWITT